MVKAIESGWAQRQIAEAAWDAPAPGRGGRRGWSWASTASSSAGRRAWASTSTSRRWASSAAAALAALRAERDSARVAGALRAVRAAADGDTNLVPVLVETVKTYATIGEIFGVLREVFGEYRAPQVF